MYRFREPIREAVLKIRLGWQWKFILSATFLALIEEVVTTTMTNLAPLFGVKVGVVFLPAYCVPPNRNIRRLRWWHYPLAFLFIPLVPLPLLIGLLPHHPKIHFPPIEN